MDKAPMLEEENRAQDVQSPFIPVTPKESIASLSTSQSSTGEAQLPAVAVRKSLPIGKTLRTRKLVPTKTMVTKALKTLANSGRKGISLMAIQKFMVEHYFTANHQIKSRMSHIKKFINELLEDGQLARIKGVGLNGSFRVPSKSPLKKDTKRASKSQKQRKSEKKQRPVKLVEGLVKKKSSQQQKRGRPIKQHNPKNSARQM